MKGVELSSFPTGGGSVFPLLQTRLPVTTSRRRVNGLSQRGILSYETRGFLLSWSRGQSRTRNPKRTTAPLLLFVSMPSGFLFDPLNGAIDGLKHVGLHALEKLSHLRENRNVLRFPDLTEKREHVRPEPILRPHA